MSISFRDYNIYDFNLKGDKIQEVIKMEDTEIQGQLGKEGVMTTLAKKINPLSEKQKEFQVGLRQELKSVEVDLNNFFSFIQEAKAQKENTRTMAAARQKWTTFQQNLNTLEQHLAGTSLEECAEIKKINKVVHKLDAELSDKLLPGVLDKTPAQLKSIFGRAGLAGKLAGITEDTTTMKKAQERMKAELKDADNEIFELYKQVREFAPSLEQASLKILRLSGMQIISKEAKKDVEKAQDEFRSFISSLVQFRQEWAEKKQTLEKLKENLKETPLNNSEEMKTLMLTSKRMDEELTKLIKFL